MAFGSLSSNLGNTILSSKGSTLKFFKRFRDSRADGWYIGRDRWDAIAFQPRLDVKIFGVGIYEPYPVGNHPFKYGHKYIIQEVGTQAEVFASPLYEEEVNPCPPSEELEDHIIKIKFE